MFPLPSVTVQVTVVIPNVKAVGALLVVEATEQLSAVTGVPKTTPVAVQDEFAKAETFAGAVIVGKVVSLTVTVCVAVLMFPLPSVTVQVTVVIPNGKAVGALLVVEATEQLSAVTGVPKTTPVAVQPTLVFTETFAGAVIVGKVVSVTVTVCVAVLMFPLPSVTVQITVVIPNGKAVGALLVVEATEQLSAVTGVPKTTLVAVQPTLVFTETFAGAVIVGKVVSVTVTTAGLKLWFPLESVAISITLFNPIFPQLKLLGEINTVKLQLSNVPLSIIVGETIACPKLLRVTVTF
jgi:hypothetical protein